MINLRKYNIDDILSYLSGEADNNENYQPAGFTPLVSFGRGSGGFCHNALLIPESIHILVTPTGCARHADFELYAEGRAIGRVYHIYLTESDIVVGTGVERVKKSVMELVESLETKPKAVTLLITCLDALLHTDYSPIERELEQKYGIRFGTIKMYSFLNTSKKTHLMIQQESIFGMTRSAGKRNEKQINMLGNTALFSEKSEFKSVLEKAGYQVKEIRTCKTFDEFDSMADSKLNLALTQNSIPAVEMMKKKYGIPYIKFYETVDLEQIRKNYQTLEEELGCKLDYEEHYLKAKEKADELRKLICGKTFAIADGYDYNSVKSAMEFAKLGGDVKYTWVQKFRKEDEQYYREMKELGQNTAFYLHSDYGLYKFREQADYQVDYAVGIPGLMILGLFGPKHLRLGEEPFDFGTFAETIDAMIQQIHQENGFWRQEKETTVYDRNWNMYRGNEYEEFV